MAMIKQTVVDEILLRTDIETLISGYVSLKRAGSMYKGLCPFHSEKSPSFIVYPQTSSFYCFGCGIGGNALTFVRQIEHLDYPDAVEFLAKRAGITVIRDDNSVPVREKSVDKKRVLAMNVEAANYFHKALISGTEGAKTALSYFKDKRGLELATIKHFGLGYAPDSPFDFMNYMIAKGYTKEELMAGYLLGKSEKGLFYPTFRHRVMFPIIDVAGDVIAFGGRVLDDSKPKYRNSSDTPVFKKSRNLFALNFARHTCSESLVLCEGYMDVIALHAAGFTNAVATLGTAITPEQARIMSRYTKRVIICYDSDEPGQLATQKAIRILDEVGLESRVVVVPGSKDPDEYIKTFGAAKFKLVLDEAKMQFEYTMDRILSGYDINMPQDLVRATQDIVKVISAVYFEAEKDVYIKLASKKLNISAESLKSDVNKVQAKNLKVAKKNESQKMIQSSIGYSDKVNKDFARSPAVAKKEEVVLGLLLLYPEHCKTVFESELLSESDFFTDFNKRVFKYVEESYKAPEAATDINELFSPEEVGRITKMKISRMELTDNGDKVLRESINSLKSSMQKQTLSKPTTFDDLQKLIDSMRTDG